MKPGTFDTLANLVKQTSGLVLTKDKVYLLESRLLPLARKRNISDLDALAAQIKGKYEGPLVQEITEAMTTNESSFFRDIKPFEQFRQTILPKFLAARAARKQLRIWSAACSTGQEAYSLAMILKEEAAKLAGWKIEIVGTDLSAEMVERSKAGVYTQFEVQRGLPIQMLVKYFKQTGDKWELKPEVRSMVSFRTCNLLGSLSSLGHFDIVFCRNVLIYFDQPTKARVLESIGRIMPSDGTLYLGGAETVLGITDRFQPVMGQRGIYELASLPAMKLAANG